MPRHPVTSLLALQSLVAEGSIAGSMDFVEAFRAEHHVIQGHLDYVMGRSRRGVAGELVVRAASPFDRSVINRTEIAIDESFVELFVAKRGPGNPVVDVRNAHPLAIRSESCSEHGVAKVHHALERIFVRGILQREDLGGIQ